MTADLELHTITAYGYRLGGPGGWQLPGLQPADQLRTAWYDETNPTHQFAERASIRVKARLGLATPELSELPWTFATRTVRGMGPDADGCAHDAGIRAGRASPMAVVPADHPDVMSRAGLKRPSSPRPSH
jgi:hypothetical protein